MTASHSEVAGYLRALAEVAAATARDHAEAIARAADLAVAALEAGGKLMFCGNGGSAADAQHLATEYVVRFERDRAALPAVALTTDTSLLTAAANDYGFDRVFARQVDAIGRSGDVLFLHSTSGASANLLAAAESARRLDIRTVALLARDGGALRSKVDLAIVIPTREVPHAQELHLAVGHAICREVERRLTGAAQ